MLHVRPPYGTRVPILALQWSMPSCPCPHPPPTPVISRVSKPPQTTSQTSKPSSKRGASGGGGAAFTGSKSIPRRPGKGHDHPPLPSVVAAARADAPFGNRAARSGGRLPLRCGPDGAGGPAEGVGIDTSDTQYRIVERGAARAGMVLNSPASRVVIKWHDECLKPRDVSSMQVNTATSTSSWVCWRALLRMGITAATAGTRSRPFWRPCLARGQWSSTTCSDACATARGGT